MVEMSSRLKIFISWDFQLILTKFPIALNIEDDGTTSKIISWKHQDILTLKQL